MSDCKKISVLIIAYHSGDYLYAAIDSILQQDYPAVELIISDDGSKDFDKNAIEKYIESNKKDNIVSVIVRTSETNEGTVKNINHGLDAYTGDYFMVFAADDILGGKSVLSSFINAFATLDASELIVTAQAMLCNEDISDEGTNYVLHARGVYLNKCSALEQYRQLAFACVFASGATMYKRAFFDCFGKCDERFFLIEDMALWLRCTHDGVKLNYFDFTALLHRDGGVSHSDGTGKVSFARKKLYEDYTHLYEYLEWPYFSMFDRCDIERLLKQYTAFRREYVAITDDAPKVMPLQQRMKYCKSRYVTKLFCVIDNRCKKLQARQTHIITTLLGSTLLLLIAKFLLNMYSAALPMLAGLALVCDALVLSLLAICGVTACVKAMLWLGSNVHAIREIISGDINE